MTVAAAVAGLLRGRQEIGVEEQAFPFLTVDEATFPHVALLSRSELDVTADGTFILAVVASRRTRANLECHHRATLVAVEGDTAHYAKLQMAQSLVIEGVLGAAFAVVEHKADSVGTPLRPISYRTSEAIAIGERWERSARILRHLTDLVAGTR